MNGFMKTRIAFGLVTMIGLFACKNSSGPTGAGAGGSGAAGSTGSSSSSGVMVCTPGATVGCTCGAYPPATQLCAADGSHYSPCTCQTCSEQGETCGAAKPCCSGLACDAHCIGGGGAGGGMGGGGGGGPTDCAESGDPCDDSTPALTCCTGKGTCNTVTNSCP